MWATLPWVVWAPRNSVWLNALVSNLSRLTRASMVVSVKPRATVQSAKRGPSKTSGGLPPAMAAVSFSNVSSVAVLGMGTSSRVTLAWRCLYGAAISVAHELAMVGLTSVSWAVIVTGAVLGGG